jgi:serine protease AprX
VASALFVAALTSAAPGLARSGGPADRNENRIADSLDARFAALGPSHRVRVIVSLKRRATPAAVRRLQAAAGKLDVRARYSVVPAFAATVTRRQAELLTARPDVARVEADAVVHAFNDTSEASFGVTKARLDAPSLDGNCNGCVPAVYSKEDLVAAVVDTGIDATHVDLDGGKVLHFVDCMTATCLDTAPFDDEGHGTHVAATAAGDGDGTADHRYQGVAPRAALVGVKVLDENGSGSSATILAGIDWVVAHRAAYGIEVMTLSLGAGSACGYGLDGSDPLSRAVDSAVDAGLVVTVAAGNSGPGRCTVSTPAVASKAIAVGAMADTGSSAAGCSRSRCRNGFKEAAFSSRGPTAAGAVKPDISAPGVDITSAAVGTGSGYVAESGTSMATPFVAGVALLMLDQNPALTPAQVKEDLTGTAVDWGAAGKDNTYGAGRLDAYAALRAAGAPIAAPPAVPAHLASAGLLPPPGASLDVPVAVTGSEFPLAATLLAPLGGATLTLLDANGDVVASSAFAGSPDDQQEELGLAPAAAGRYVLRIATVGGGGSYTLDLSGAFTRLISPPRNTTPPAIAGNPRDGSLLTAVPGAWASTLPLGDFTFRWVRCDRHGSNCLPIAGAAAAQYRARPVDVGHRLRVEVTLSNDAGSATAESAAVAIAAARVVNRIAPTITGTPRVGRTLRAHRGRWTGTPRLKFAYVWLRCKAGTCRAIPRATHVTYRVRRADVGKRLRVRVSARSSRSPPGAGASRASRATRPVRR